MINYGDIDPNEMLTNKDVMFNMLQMSENNPFLRRLNVSSVSIFGAMVKNRDTLWKNLVDTLCNRNIIGVPRVKQLCLEIANSVSLLVA